MVYDTLITHMLDRLHGACMFTYKAGSLGVNVGKYASTMDTSSYNQYSGLFMGITKQLIIFGRLIWLTLLVIFAQMRAIGILVYPAWTFICLGILWPLALFT